MFGKIWGMFVAPWAIFKVERAGWRPKYVYARKFFGFMQFVQYYSYDDNQKAKVSATTFSFDNAHEFENVNHHHKITKDQLNLKSKDRKRKINVTKVEIE